MPFYIVKTIWSHIVGLTMYHRYDDLSKSQQEVTDYMLPMGAVLIFATTFAIINLLLDILYVYVDPRIRYDG